MLFGAVKFKPDQIKLMVDNEPTSEEAESSTSTSQSIDGYKCEGFESDTAEQQDINKNRISGSLNRRTFKTKYFERNRLAYE